MWSPPDPYEPTSELYRLMPKRKTDDDPFVLISPETPRWRMLAAKAKPASRRALVWAWGLVTLTLAGVLYPRDLRLPARPLGPGSTPGFTELDAGLTGLNPGAERFGWLGTPPF